MGITRSTSPRDDLAQSIENLKMAVTVLNAVVATKLAGDDDTKRTDVSSEDTTTVHTRHVVDAG